MWGNGKMLLQPLDGTASWLISEAGSAGFMDYLYTDGAGDRFVVSTDTGAHIGSLKDRSSRFDAVAGGIWHISRNGERITSVPGGRVVVQTFEGEQLLGRPLDGASYFPALSPDGERVALSHGLGRVDVIDVESGELVDSATVDVGAPRVSWDGEGEKVIVSSGTGSEVALLWAVGDTPLRLEGHEADIRWAELSRDGSMVLTCSVDGTVRIWNTDVIE